MPSSLLERSSRVRPKRFAIVPEWVLDFDMSDRRCGCTRCRCHDARVVAYCRGPHRVVAATAVGRLRESGFDAARLAAGYPDWASAHPPIAA